MAVYVDAIQIEATVGRIHAHWSHLTADTSAELRAFAARLGLRPQWIQYPGTWKEHFDVIESKRQLALKYGALPLTIRAAGERLKARRTGTEWEYSPPELTEPQQGTLWGG